jgi:8-oxo-dGTP pyrophosphatase MutT (NUDIX family)
LIKVVWDLTETLPKRRINNQVVVKPITRDQLQEVGKILVVTWGGFIKEPETTVNYVGPYMDKELEQPFIAYLKGKPVGCISPRLDKETKSGVLDGGVHVLHPYRRQRIGTTLLFTALKWLKDNGMRSAWVTPNNPESEEATKRAEAFYLSTGNFAMSGVHGLIIQNGRILFIKRGVNPLIGYWGLPAGKIEEGESFSEALKREVFEEIGVNVDDIEEVGVMKGSLFGMPQHIFHCRQVSGNPVPQNIEVEEICWLSYDKLKNLKMVPGLKEFLISLDFQRFEK